MRFSFSLYSLVTDNANRVNTRKNPIVQEYVLPDFSTNRKGYIRSGPNATRRELSPTIDGDAKVNDDPVLYMANERFTVPEVLFHPADVGEYEIHSSVVIPRLVL